MDASGVSLVLVGDELLDGRVVETNGRWLIEALGEDGIAVVHMAVVADDVAAIQASLARAVERSAAVVVTGGLGPTPDDLTREALAALAAEPLVEDPQVLAGIRERYARRGRTMPEANRRQALRTPSGIVLANEWGTAPGLAQFVAAVPVVLLPGVPRELRGMWPGQARDIVRKAARPRRNPPIRLRTAGIGESDLADRVAAALDPAGLIPVAYCVGPYGVDLLVGGTTGPKARAAAQRLEEALGSLVFARGKEDLPAVVVAALAAARQTVTVAESCTGGLLGAALTSVAGSSRVFPGGVVAYADDVKQALLDVDPRLLKRHGAVSPEVAGAMARGARARLRTDWAVAITGIAGPGGATPDKPVGTVWIAVEGPATGEVRRLHLPGDRGQNRRWSVARALDMLRLALGRRSAP